MPLAPSKQTSQDLFFLIPLSLFIFIFRLGTGALASWDEAIYASVAKEVLQSGQWLRPTLMGNIWLEKPPLCIWATALCFKLFGINEFAARIFSAACGAGTVIATYFLGRRLFNRWTGFLGALVLLTSSHFIRFSRFGVMDAPLTLFVTLAFYFFWSGRRRERDLVFSGLAFALAFMVKGPAAFFIPLVTWLYCWVARDRDVLRRPLYWAGLAAAVAVIAAWSIYQAVFFHDVLAADVSLHFFRRLTETLDGHAGGIFFYLRVLVNKFHPWILIGIFSAPYFLFRALKDREEEFVFLSVWMFLILALITAVRTKLAWYLLPVYPALSLSVAYFVAMVFRERSAWVAKGLFLVIAALHVPYSHIFNHDYSRDIRGIAPAVVSRVTPAQAVALYNYHESPAISFYMGRRCFYLDSKEEFLNKASEPHLNLLIRAKDLEILGPSVLTRQGLTQQAAFEDLYFFSK